MVSVLSHAGPEVTGITSGPAVAEVVAVLGLVETKPGLWPGQGVAPRHPISGSLYLVGFSWYLCFELLPKCALTIEKPCLTPLKF